MTKAEFIDWYKPSNYVKDVGARDFNFRADLEQLLSDNNLNRMINNMIEDRVKEILAEQAKPPEPVKEEEDYVSGKWISKKLGISIQTLIRHRNSGKIPAHRFGGRVLYLLSEVEKSMVKTNRWSK